METIQVYAKQINIDAESEIANITLSGVDINQLIEEFSPQDVLDCLSYSDIVQYVSDVEEMKRESEDYQYE